MKLIRSIIAITVALAVAVGFAGDSAPFRLDTMGGTRVARETETIAYSTEWDNGGKVLVAVDGVTLKEAVAPASGDVTWSARNASVGNHTLTHTTYKNGVADKVETVTFAVKAFYTITFNANGGSLESANATRLMAEGTAIGTLPTPTRTGYTFAGWWTAASGGTQISASTTVTGNVTYYAHWTVNQYTVTFNANGGTGGTTKTQNYGTSLSAPTVTRTGYTFTGWSPSVPSTMPAGNTTYTAQWEVQYTVTFNANGGNGGYSKKQDRGSAIVAPTVTREWCTFAGWSPAVAATVPANDVTYTAQWRRWGDSISSSKMGGKTMKQLYPNDYAHMTTVVLEEGITELPEGFFDGCDNLEKKENLTLPESLREFGIDDLPTKIRSSLAYDRNGFMIYNGWILDYQNRNASAVTITNGIVGIGRGVFAGMVKLITVTMPDSLRCIAMGAFENCTSIHEFQFMSGLRYVGPVAFRNCTQLQRAVFVDGVESIGTNAFDNCWRMMSVDLPYTVTNVGNNAFSGCDKITGVTVPTHVKTMQELFPASYTKIETAEVAERETYVMDDMFKGCSALTWGATRIDTSIIPFTVTNIGARAFQNCTSLEAFIIPNSVVEIGESVFNGCTKLKEVTLSDKLTAIPDYAFYGCTSLPSLDIPASVAYLGQRFFSGCVPEPGQVIVNTLRYCCSNAPAYHPDAYAAISGEVCTKVFNGSCGWDGIAGSTSLPRTWPNRYGQDIDFWDPPKIKVTFNANGGWVDLSGGSTWAELELTYGYPYRLPPTDPVWSGEDFQGWYTSPKGGTKIEDNKTIVTATQPQELFAHWISLGDKITVKFNAMGGSMEPEDEERPYTPGQTYEYLPPPLRLGYRFGGWFTAQEGGDLITEATLVRPSCKLLFAHWTPITYYLRFHANGGTGTMADQPFIYGEHDTLAPCLFTCTGCKFIGWATTPVGQVRYEERGSTDRILEEVNEEIVHLYAMWSDAAYTVRFDGNGADSGSMDVQTIAIGETRNLRTCAFARGGYTFVGWALSATKANAKEVAFRDGEAVRNLSTVNDADVPLYAVWVAEDQAVRITFDATGGSVAPNNYWDCVVGTAVEAFPTPTRPGFTFAGWWTEKIGGTRVSSIARVTRSQTFYAHWVANGGVVPGDGSCTVTFNANGGSVSPTTRKVSSGAAVGTLPTPSRTGYTFAGWWTSASGGTQISATTKVTSSVTYYAHWTTGGSSGGGSYGGGSYGGGSYGGGSYGGGSSGGGSYGGGGRGAASSSTVYTRYANGYTWAYRVYGDGVEIVGGYYCDDYGECYVGISPDPTGAVSIPSTLGGKPVRYVGSFGWYDGLTSLTIPDSVKAIASCAFMECSALTSLVVPTWCRNAMYDSRYGDVVQSGGDSGYYLDEESFLSFLFGCPCQGGSDGCSERVAARVRVTYRDVKVSEQGVGSGGGPASAVPVSATSCYEIIGTDIAAPYEAPKAVVLQGAVYDGCKVVGIVELKLGKVNNKKGTGKVSGSVTTLDGKKHTIQAFNLTGIDGTASKSVSLEVKDFGTMSVTIGGTRFAGSMGKYHVQSAAVGGNATGGTKVYVDAGGASLPAGTLEDLLPNGVPVIAAGGKWKFAKAAGVNWTKPKQGAALPERYDAESGKGLVVNTSGDKTNLSGMKLNYTPKKGTFKGSFKVYALEGTGKATKLKKYTVKVSGVVVGGKGWGSAMGPGGASFAVTVE